MSSIEEGVPKIGFLKLNIAHGDKYRNVRPEISKYDGVTTITYYNASGSTSETDIQTINVRDKHKVAIELIGTKSANAGWLIIKTSTDNGANYNEWGRIPLSTTTPQIIDLSASPMVIQVDGLTNVKISYIQGTAGEIWAIMNLRQLEL